MAAPRGAGLNPDFDPAWYVAQHPDVAAAGIDPITHYILFGAAEGRQVRPDPAPTFATECEVILAAGLFDREWYFKSYPDVAAGGCDPLLHYLEYGYLEYGYLEGRFPNEMFDSAWYLRQHNDVAGARINPLLHYAQHGAWEGRDPHPEFSTSWYIHNNPEPLGEGVNPFTHYIRECRRNGRPPISQVKRYRDEVARQRLRDADERPELLQHIAVMTYRPSFIILIEGESHNDKTTICSLEQQLYPPSLIPSFRHSHG